MSKTYAEDFFSRFPDAEHSIFNYDIPTACRAVIYGECYCGRCSECWTEEINEKECDTNEHNS